MRPCRARFDSSSRSRETLTTEKKKKKYGKKEIHLRQPPEQRPTATPPPAKTITQHGQHGRRGDPHHYPFYPLSL